MLMLGDFLFGDFEIPEKQPFPGEQMLAIHKQIGGGRVIDALGPDPGEIKWSGRFQGGDAIGRARQLEDMRDAGQPVTLVWETIVRSVVVKSFEPTFERPYQATYEISVVVVPDDQDGEDVASLDDAVNSDLSSGSQFLG